MYKTKVIERLIFRIVIVIDYMFTIFSREIFVLPQRGGDIFYFSLTRPRRPRGGPGLR